MKKLFLLLFLLSCAAIPAMAEMPCLKNTEAVANLMSKGFVPMFNGYTQVETYTVWVRKDGVWVATVLRSDGWVCELVEGDDFSYIPPGEPV